MSEVEIEKTVLSITVWHHEACGIMTKGDSEGQIFLSHPHTNIYLSCSPFNFYLRNEFNFWNVHGIMNASGLLQS